MVVVVVVVVVVVALFVRDKTSSCDQMFCLYTNSSEVIPMSARDSSAVTCVLVTFSNVVKVAP